MTLALRAVLWGALVCGSSARAQGLDAHGTTVGPLGSTALAPTLVADPRLEPAGTATLGLLGEYASAPLVRYREDAGERVSEALLEHVVAGGFGASWTPVAPVELGLVAPVFAYADGAGALGDLWLQGSLGILRPEGDGPALALVPFATLPTGASDRFLGDGGVGGGGLASLGLRSGPFQLSVDSGVELDASSDADLPGGARFRGAAGVAYRLSPHVALHAEGRTSAPLAPDAAVPGLPTEVALLARDDLSSGAFWVAGVGAGVLEGPGSAAVRAFAGVGVTLGGRAEPEVVPPDLTVWARDPAGRPVRGAQVLLDGRALGSTDHEGRVVVPAELSWGELAVSARGLQGAAVEPPAAGIVEVRVELAWTPVEVAVRVVDQRGKLMDAELELTGPGPAPSPTRDDVGTARYTLAPGTWSLTASAPGMGAQTRSVPIPEGREDPIRIDIALVPEGGAGSLALRLRDETGAPVEGAVVQLGGHFIGTTGSGGDVEISALEEGVQRLDVQHHGFEAARDVEVQVGAEGEAHELGLRPVHGTVRVQVRGPDGAATDALIAFRGPVSLPPSRLGRLGTGSFVLRDGTWTALISSATLGLQERQFHVDGRSKEPTRVDVELRPAEGGSATLALVVTDATGRPLPGAAVSVDDAPVGVTANDGVLRLEGLAAGQRALEVRRRGARTWRADIALDDAREVEVVLQREAGRVEVRVRGAGGRAAAGLVRASNGMDHVTATLDADGRATLELAPGTWDVLFSDPDLGILSSWVVVSDDDTALLDLDFFMGDEGGSSELVVRVTDPDGAPVVGARVLVDGTELGTTSNGGTLGVGALRAGSRRLIVEAAALERAERTVVLGRGSRQVDLELGWAPGAVRVRCTGPDGPLSGVVLRIAGARSFPPMSTDRAGERLVGLEPGPWVILASSPGYGIQQQQLEVPAAPTPSEVVFAFTRAPSGVLLVRVRDEDHEPVAGADVQLDAQFAGATTTGGAVLIEGLAAGTHELGVAPPEPLQRVDRSVVVGGGSAQVGTIVRYPRSAVRLQARDGRLGQPAEVWLEGPAVEPARRSDDEGRLQVELRPGRWVAHARTADERIGIAEFAVVPGVPVPEIGIPLEQGGVSLAQGKLRLDHLVLFDLGRAELVPEAEPVLDALAARLSADYSIVRAEVQGHTDDQGSLQVNLTLSQRRADAVVAALVARGVGAERLQARGYGMLRPLAAGTDEASRALNRRVEVHVVEAVEGLLATGARTGEEW